MADIAAVAPSTSGVVSTPTASTPAGDTITGVAATNGLILNIFNGHGSSITVGVTATAVARTITGYGTGTFTLANLSVAVAAGAYKSIYIPATSMAGYLDSNDEVPITYTSGNAALTVQALII